jgi:hypothetical protein
MGAALGPGGLIYVIGGYSTATNPAVQLNSTDVYDPVTNTWSTAAPMPTPRDSLGVVAGSDAKFYAIGGEKAGAGVGGVEAYDPLSDTWQTMAPMLTPRFLFGSARSFDGRIFAIGGIDANNTFGVVTNEAFRPGPLYHLCALYDSAKAVNSGATLPVKLQLCDASGNDLSSSSITVHAIRITKTSNATSADVQDSGNANPDNDFRFDATLGSTGGYIFNLSTKGLTTGTYNLNFNVTGDSAAYATPFRVK